MKILVFVLLFLLITNNIYSETRLAYAIRIETEKQVQILKIYSDGIIEFYDGNKVRIYKQMSEEEYFKQ